MQRAQYKGKISSSWVTNYNYHASAVRSKYKFEDKDKYKCDSTHTNTNTQQIIKAAQSRSSAQSLKTPLSWLQCTTPRVTGHWTMTSGKISFREVEKYKYRLKNRVKTVFLKRLCKSIILILLETY